VLAIPLVLFALALSVIVGTAACWKVRASVVARNAIWTHRMPRSDRPVNPRPSGWPLPATSNHTNSRPLTALNNPAFQNPLVRGPLPNQVVVNAGLFDPAQAVRLGESHIQRTPAMLPRLGPYQFSLVHPLLDGKWQFRQMRLAHNDSRRLPVLYQFPDGDSSERAAFQQAYQNILSAPFRPDLDVLDRDEELRAWFGSYIDFHPRLRQFCSLDSSVVHEQNVRPLLARIEQVPRRLTQTFLRMYRQQLAILQNMPPPLTAAQQAQIADLQQKIKILQDFLATLN
jgi:hypothetical protein